MSGHSERVRDFFNRAAVRYRDKPDSTTGRYFSRRLKSAIDLANPSAGDRILDVGCGTGLLYDQLCYFEAIKDNYFGIDLSPGMLAKSRIPKRQQRQISFADFHADLNPTERFDLIFALGLTTYLTPPKFEDFHKIIAERLTAGGRAIVSYTHANGYDFQFRDWLNRRMGGCLPDDSSLGRDFPILATTPERVAGILPEQLSIQTVEWLPPAFPGLGLLPASFRNYLTGSDPEKRWRGDFLLELVWKS